MITSPTPDFIELYFLSDFLQQKSRLALNDWDTTHAGLYLSLLLQSDEWRRVLLLWEANPAADYDDQKYRKYGHTYQNEDTFLGRHVQCIPLDSSDSLGPLYAWFIGLGSILGIWVNRGCLVLCGKHFFFINFTLLFMHFGTKEFSFSDFIAEAVFFEWWHPRQVICTLKEAKWKKVMIKKIKYIMFIYLFWRYCQPILKAKAWCRQNNKKCRQSK